MLELNKTYLGDCLELMHLVDDESVDLVLADLPYGTTKCKWDSIIPLEELWAHYNRIIKPDGVIVLTAQTPFDKVLGASNLKMLRYEWIWEKTSATGHLNAKKMPMKAHENVLVFYKDKPRGISKDNFNRTYNPQSTTGHKPTNTFNKTSDSEGDIYGKVTGNSGGGKTSRYPRSVLKFPSDKQTSSLHPTQKPISLGKYFTETYSNEGDVVLDNVAGSGTFGLAAKLLNRKYILMEKDLHNYSVCKKRLDEV